MNHSTIDPRTLRITDMRFVDIDGAPKRYTILKLMTNQGLVGYGEVRDAASKTYALMLKSRLLGENPCDVDRIFHKIKQFGGPSRQAGGVCGVLLSAGLPTRAELSRDRNDPRRRMEQPEDF